MPLDTRLDIARGIDYAGIRKTLPAQAATIAFAAGQAFCRGLVARDCQAVVHTQFDSGTDNFTLTHLHQGAVDSQLVALNASPGGEVSHGFEGAYVLGAAIGVTGIIHSINAG